MKDSSFNRILLAAVLLLAIGEGYLLVQRTQPNTATPQGPMDVTASTSSAPVTQTPAPSNILTPLGGVVASISGNMITISQADTSVHVSVSSGTTIVQEGQLKDSTTYEADLQKFHQETQQLMQDPQRNQLALETLISPSRYTETPISLSQIVAGDTVLAYASGQGASGTYEAFRIQVTPNTP